jgi:hypothetical protein
MTIRLRPILFLLALVTLNQAVCLTDGVYTRRVFMWTAVAFAIGLTATLMSDRALHLGTVPRGEGVTLALALCAITLTCLGMWQNHISFNDKPLISARIPDVAAAAFLLTLLIGVLSIREATNFSRTLPRIIMLLLLCAVLTIGFMARALVIRASPEPVIDVYNLLRDSADFILQGKNPYANDYHSPYHTERAKSFDLYYPEHPVRVPGYPPLAYLLCTIPRFFRADIRWVHAAADMLAALALFLIALRRLRPLAGLLAASLYLHLPGTAFVVERAWIEPFLVGLFGIGFWLVESPATKSRVMGHVLLGIAFTGKQYGLPIYLPFAWAYRRQWRYLLAGLGAGLAVILPFFLWSPRDFVDIVVTQHLTKEPGYHSITMVSAVYDLSQSKYFGPSGASQPPDLAGESKRWFRRPVILWLISGPLLLLLSARSRAGAECALAVGSALFTYVIFSTVGFMNYYFLVQYLWLLGVVGVLSVRSVQNAVETGLSVAKS